MILSSLLKRKKGNSPVSKLEETKLSSLAKTLLRYAVLVLAVETASNLGKAIVKMQKSHFAIGTRKAVAVILTFSTASVAQFALEVNQHKLQAHNKYYSRSHQYHDQSARPASICVSMQQARKVNLYYNI